MEQFDDLLASTEEADRDALLEWATGTDTGKTLLAACRDQVQKKSEDLKWETTRTEALQLIVDMKALLESGPDGWAQAKPIMKKIRSSIESLRTVKAYKGKANGLEQEFEICITVIGSKYFAGALEAMVTSGIEVANIYNIIMYYNIIIL